MLFNVVLFSGLLLSSAALAAPGLGARIAHGSGLRSSQPSDIHNVSSNAVSNTVYSTNWAGAVWNETGNTFTSVTGTFTVPTPSGAVGASAAAWVGIDGYTCQTAILQTGVSFTVENGQTTYVAWHEWYPAPSVGFSDFTISAGDNIKLTVTATSTTTGTATIENLSTGQTVSENLSSSAALCGQNVEWIVEDYKVDGALVPFANFGTVTFTNAEANQNSAYTPSGATTMDIDQNNQILTSVSTDGSSVTIQYE